jgi:hypothetical protein
MSDTANMSPGPFVSWIPDFRRHTGMLTPPDRVAFRTSDTDLMLPRLSPSLHMYWPTFLEERRLSAWVGLWHSAALEVCFHGSHTICTLNLYHMSCFAVFRIPDNTYTFDKNMRVKQVKSRGNVMSATRARQTRSCLLLNHLSHEHLLSLVNMLRKRYGMPT